MEPTTYKETTRISVREYCPTRRVPENCIEIMLKEVQREDQINHACAPRPSIPKYEKEKVPQPQWVKHFIKGTLGQLMP
jgi:hypothetical protein